MKKILFHHIPKTAGTSLVTQARLLFGQGVHDGRYDAEVSEADMLDERYVFYHGHFTRRFVETFRNRVPDARIFTFLRHPFNRTLSQYYNWTDEARVRHELDVVTSRSGYSMHVRLLRNKFERKIFGMSLEQFLRSRDPDILQASDNLQAQYMTAADGKPSHLRFNTATYSAISFYDFIGIQELYEPCLRILEAVCGLPARSFDGTSRENHSDYAKSEGRYRVGANDLRLLERRNVYDLALYHACYGLLLKQHGVWLPPLACDVDRAVPLPEVVEHAPGRASNGRSRSDGLAPFARRTAC